MRTSYFFLLLILVIISCNDQDNTSNSPDTIEQTNDNDEASDSSLSFPEAAKDMTIYEVNIRQSTPEGTLKAFQEHLPRLKDLGVEILWLMPIQPIGEKNRKGPLGSYYSIKDYTSINPEFGTLEDFKALVDKAHEMGLYIILDWVPNHTAWDHPWIESNPEYYMTDSAASVVGEFLGFDEGYYKPSGTGNLVYESDWNDIALLNLHNQEVRKAMVDAMAFWIEEADIDGFRADHAFEEIPLYFWEEATEALNPLKDLFWLAEADQPRMHLEFHATYDWSLLHLTEDVAKGEKTAEDIHLDIMKDLRQYGQDAYRLNMITNHDENAWAGTIEERYGKEGGKAFAVFSFTAYGVPLIYSGQEVGMDKRLRFFSKDTISWDDPENFTAFYTSLIELKKNNPALWSGGYGAMPQKLFDQNENVFSFKRNLPDNQVIGLINLSSSEQEIMLDDASLYGTHNDYFTNKEYTLGDQSMTLKPWQYLIFTN